MISYDRIAKNYDQTRKIPHDSLEKIIIALDKEIPNLFEKEVIDLGVGTGRFAIPLSKKVKNIVGIDISKKMIDILLQNNSSNNLTAICGNIEQIPFSNGSFDIALAVSIFHLIPNWKKVIDEIERVIKPTGYCIIGHTEYIGKYGKQYEYIRYKLLRKHLDSANAKGLSFSEQKTVFEERWKLYKTINAAEWDDYFIPKELLNSIETNTWSETWDTKPSKLHKVIRKMKHDIIQEGINLEQKYDLKIRFVFSIYSLEK